MFHLGRLLLVGLLLLGSVAGRDSWEKPSFEDQDFDSDEGSPEYMEPETYSKVTVCSGDEEEVCSCAKGNHPTLNCVGQGLESANLRVSGKMGESFQVQIAHLVGNQISYLFKGKILPGHEQSLMVLDLSNNTIMDIQPGALDKFNALVELRLTNNSLHELSEDIFTPSLANLHKLYLDYNLLDSLDKGLFNNLKNLKKLVLDGNKDLGISNEVLSTELSQLEVLSMDRCGLKQLDPDLFINLPNLRALSLSGNELISIPEAISPVKLPQLEVLAMSNTYLTVLRGEVLAKAVPKLEKLYMRKMKHLTTIDECAFCNLPLIKSLDFSNSPKLSEIHQMAFGPKMPGNLESLNLRNCNFSGLVEGTLSDVNFGTLATLRLDGNPWNCDCDLKWLLNNDRAMRKAQQKDNPICAAPKGMKGVRLFDANAKLDCGPEGTSSMGQFIVLLLFMVMGATVVVFGVFYARRRFVLAGYGENGNFRVPNFLEGRGPRIPQNQMGFASGRSIFDDDIEEEGEGDDEEETGQEAMATGQPRPEFV